MAKKLVLVVAAVLVMGLVGYFSASKVWGFPVFGAPGSVGLTGTPVVKTTTVNFGQFMTNLIEPGRFIRISVEVETVREHAEGLTERMSQLKTDIYALLRSKSYTDLLGEDGLRDLQRDMLQRIDSTCPDCFTNVFFSEFIVQ